MNLIIIGFIVFCLVGGYIMVTANACGFVNEDSIVNSGTDYYYDRYDSSNWTMPDNIYNPDNYDECFMLGWC
tara:strand:+ start:146 stop:361 length:216 start_codon:yes stop_codon:yes gene_type:complete